MVTGWAKVGFQIPKTQIFVYVEGMEYGRERRKSRGTEARDKGRRWAWSTGGRSRLKGDGRAHQLRQ